MSWAEMWAKRLYKGFKRSELKSQQWSPTDRSFSSDEGQFHCTNQRLISIEDQRDIDIKEWRRALADVPMNLSKAEKEETEMLQNMEQNPVSTVPNERAGAAIYIKNSKCRIDGHIQPVIRVLAEVRGPRYCGSLEKYLSQEEAKSYIERVSRLKRSVEMARDYLDNIEPCKDNPFPAYYRPYFPDENGRRQVSGDAGNHNFHVYPRPPSPVPSMNESHVSVVSSRHSSRSSMSSTRAKRLEMAEEEAKLTAELNARERTNQVRQMELQLEDAKKNNELLTKLETTQRVKQVLDSELIKVELESKADDSQRLSNSISNPVLNVKPEVKSWVENSQFCPQNGGIPFEAPISPLIPLPTQPPVQGCTQPQAKQETFEDFSPNQFNVQNMQGNMKNDQFLFSPLGQTVTVPNVALSNNNYAPNTQQGIGSNIAANLAPAYSASNVGRTIEIAPKYSQTSMINTTEDLGKILIQHTQRNLLPPSSVTKFSGNDCTEYHSWLRSLQTRVFSRTDDPSECLSYVEQFTSGAAQTLVRSCMHLPPDLGLQRALQALEKTYGNGLAICQAYTAKLRKWPSVKNDDVNGLRDFSVFLSACANAMTTVPGLEELNYASHLQVVVSKLPNYIGNRWSRKAELMSASGQPVRFMDIMEFVNQEYRIAANPVFGKQSKEKTSPQGGSNNGKPESKSVKLAAAVSDTSVSVSAFDKPCAFCTMSNHSLSHCNKLKSKPFAERISVLRKHGMCFGCLKKGHMVGECPKKMTCDRCQCSHPTVLHVNKKTDEKKEDRKEDDNSDDKKDSTIGAATKTAIAKTECTMNIIPVYVKLPGSGKEILTYCFHDEGSSECFINERFAKRNGHRGGQRHKLYVKGMTNNRVTSVRAIHNLEVRGVNETASIVVKRVFTWPSEMPVTKENIPLPKDLEQWPHLTDVDLPSLMDCEIGLVLGNNVPIATEPVETVKGELGDPYAAKTVLGWQIHGNLRQGEDEFDVEHVSACATMISGDELHKSMKDFFNRDFVGNIHSEEKSPSIEDKKFLQLMDEGCYKKNGQYHMPLPLKNNDGLPNNRKMAEQRLKSIERKFANDATFREQYKGFIDNLIEKGYATIVEEDEPEPEVGMVWYLPHHAVFHPRKKKIRVVFDATAEFMGISLNGQLIQGPDLMNKLLGVLLRWRQYAIAFMADLESMFYRVKVIPEHRDLLRFLWWPNGDVTKKPRVYRMNAHIFGAVSSPSVCIYALNRIAADNKDKYSDEALVCLIRNFYMDDLLKSVRSTVDVSALTKELVALCKEGDQDLRQWVSNSREVIASIPEKDRASKVAEIDLNIDDLPGEHALGVYWNPNNDTLGFKCRIKEKPYTRSGVLSTIASFFDPANMGAPFVVEGKKFMQQLCSLGVGWNDPLPPEFYDRWSKWVQQIPKLDAFELPRCLVPVEFEDSSSTQLHHFSDASQDGYGTVTYLRLVNDHGHIHCSFVLAKARVAPLKTVTIPRLELTAATVAVGVDEVLRKELDLNIDYSYFWTDSTSVLGYVKNETARFHVFVANRVQRIRERSAPEQWRYVPTDLNPADEVSRGQDADTFLKNDRWRNGPEFLWMSEDNWPNQLVNLRLDKQDPEVKMEAVVASSSVAEEDFRSTVMERFSSWYRLCRFVALMIRCARGFKHVKGKKPGVDPRKSPVNNALMSQAERTLVIWSQEIDFPDERKVLSKEKGILAQNNAIAPLTPFLLNGVIRVGGRLANADINEDSKHPIILSNESPIAKLIIVWTHKLVGHSGREHVLSKLREKYWILKAPAMVKRILKACVKCRRNYGAAMSQFMAPLPADRVTPDEPPFTRVGIDYFGPIIVKRGRSDVKRYGALFTCLQIRAVHIEMAESLETDAFINVLRRFIARRGQVKIFRSDNGTNFVGAEKEIKASIAEWNDQAEDFCQVREIEWKFNSPSASHHGGVWERMIRSARKILLSLTEQQTLTDDRLSTLFAETEIIMNSRPLTKVSDDPRDLRCITPNDLLLFKNAGSLPPGVFSDSDNYCRRRWRQVQYLANVFWNRWTKEYLPLLQARQKWIQPHKNVQKDDIVLVIDNTVPRGSWPLARVDEVYPDADGHIRNVKVITRNSTLVRPISKLCMILEADGENVADVADED